MYLRVSPIEQYGEKGPVQKTSVRILLLYLIGMEMPSIGSHKR